MINLLLRVGVLRKIRYERELERLPHDSPTTVQPIQSTLEQLETISPCPPVQDSPAVFSAPESIDLTVIVPVFNNRDYVDQCLVSALSQKTRFSFEVIAVDDGSTDGSSGILDALSNKFDHLKVIHQDNRGHSGARNSAINIASGRFICFLDSDDFLPQGAFERLMRPATDQNADIVGSGYWSCLQSGAKRRYYGLRHGSFSSDSNPIRLSGLPWGSVYKRMLWDGVRFPEGYWFEDTVVPYLIFSRSSKILSVTGSTYNYRTNLQGITSRSVQSKKGLDSFWVVLEMLKQLKRLGIEMNQRLFEQTLHQFGALLKVRVAALDEDELALLFSACCSLIRAMTDHKDFSRPKDFWLAQLLDSFIERDYRHWQTICRWMS